MDNVPYRIEITAKWFHAGEVARWLDKLVDADRFDGDEKIEIVNVDSGERFPYATHEDET